MDIMINKYIAVIGVGYDTGWDGELKIEFQPFQSNYDKQLIESAYDTQVGIFPFIGFTILDTGIKINNDNRLCEVVTIQEWFTKYATGVKETRDDVDKKISLQYTNK